MKLFNQFTILPRYLKAFNYAGSRMEEITRNLDPDNHLFEDYWKRECRDHPTNQHCLVSVSYTHLTLPTTIEV